MPGGVTSGDPWAAWRARNIVPIAAWPRPYMSTHSCHLRRPLPDRPCTVTRLLRAARTGDVDRAAAAHCNYTAVCAAHQVSLSLRRAEALQDLGFGTRLALRRARIAANHDRIMTGALRAYETQLQQANELMQHQRRTIAGRTFRARIGKRPRHAAR